MVLIPGLGRSLGGGHGNPLQYSCLESTMHRGAWKAVIHGAAESDITEYKAVNECLQVSVVPSTI